MCEIRVGVNQSGSVGSRGRLIDAGIGLIEQDQVEVIGGRSDMLQGARSAARSVKGDRPRRLHQLVERPNQSSWIGS